MTGNQHPGAALGPDGRYGRSVVPPGVWIDDSDEDDPLLRNADGSLVDTWREEYPYPERLSREEYDHLKRGLQIELLKLQYWVRETGGRFVVVFEGRDAAGKGSTIKRFMEHLNPRFAQVVALDIPTEREKHQWYFQRYVAHLPTAGEMVLFDRSWYNRAGVERVMGFCTTEEYEEFMHSCPRFERLIQRSGVILIKYWLSVSDDEQERRFQARLDNPLKRWKLSPTDLEARARWVDYAEAKDEMFARTDTEHSPWFVVESDDKRSTRLNLISHLLDQIPYKRIDQERVTLPPRQQRVYERPPRSSEK
ncbi:MAG TPA: polyphosphate kinase 2 [Streptosporangiaceae bacterium]